MLKPPKQGNFIFGGSSVIPKVKSGTRSGYGVGTLPGQSSIIASALVPRQSLVPKQLTGLEVKQRTIQQQIIQQPITQQPLISPGLFSNTGFGLGGFGGFPLPAVAKFGRSKRQIQKKPQRTQYQPSFSGSILNLRIDKPGISPGGLSLRGIVSPKKPTKKISKKQIEEDKKKKKLWWN